MGKREENIQVTTGNGDVGSSLLEMWGIEKSYGGVRALRGASLAISGPGRVHTLVGENGSGKSTLLGVLAGQLRPDSGTIALQGEEVSFSIPADAIKRGVAMVSQETAIAADLTVAENILLGRRLVRGPLGISRARSRVRAEEMLGRLGLDLDPNTYVRDLRPDQQQMVEIARALSLEARLLILDEPTSSLTEDEVERLFAAIREVKSHGVAILFVSHRFDDLFEIADEVTVLRDGATVHASPMEDMTEHSLIEAMVGDSIEQREATIGNPPLPHGRKVVLSVTGLNVEGVLSNIAFDLHDGEILGVAGLSGAGRSELLEAIYGVLPCTGELEVGGEQYQPRNPRHAIRAGVGYLPADRKTQALTLTMSVRDNLNVIKRLERRRLSLIRPGEETEWARELADSMRVKADSVDALAGGLSGGNQQKVALGRWLAVNRTVLLLDEPTRGVDVAAKWEIQARLRALAAEGLSLLVSSSENDELRSLCDRIIVLFRGEIVASFKSEQANDAVLARTAGGKA